MEIPLNYSHPYTLTCTSGVLMSLSMCNYYNNANISLQVVHVQVDVHTCT